MGIDFSRNLINYNAIVGNILSRDLIFESLFANLPGCRFSGISTPTATDEPNFGFFIQKINFGADVSIIVGNASNNKTAGELEARYQESIQLSGIIAFHSDESGMVVDNRHGQFRIQSSVDQEACVILRIHDFQKDCLYICGSTDNAMILGSFVWGLTFNDVFSDALATDDTILATGSFRTVKQNISPTCIREGESTLAVDSINLQNLRTLDHDV